MIENEKEQGPSNPGREKAKGKAKGKAAGAPGEDAETLAAVSALGKPTRERNSRFIKVGEDLVLRINAYSLEEGEQARLLVVVERRGIVAETIVDVVEGDVTKAEYALDGAQPVILAASVSYVDDASFVVPAGVATEPSDALPPHEAHPLPAHRTPFPKPLM